MYAAILNDEILALHEDVKPIKKFIKLQSYKNKIKIIKLKKKGLSKITDIDKEELYLTNYRGMYIPNNFLKELSDFVEGNRYNLLNAVCALEDIMNSNISKDDKKNVKRTTELLIKECYNVYELSDLKYLKAIKDLKGGF